MGRGADFPDNVTSAGCDRGPWCMLARAVLFPGGQPPLGAGDIVLGAALDHRRGWLDDWALQARRRRRGGGGEGAGLGGGRCRARRLWVAIRWSVGVVRQKV